MPRGLSNGVCPILLLPLASNFSMLQSINIISFPMGACVLTKGAINTELSQAMQLQPQTQQAVAAGQEQSSFDCKQKSNINEETALIPFQTKYQGNSQLGQPVAKHSHPLNSYNHLPNNMQSQSYEIPQYPSMLPLTTQPAINLQLSSPSSYKLIWNALTPCVHVYQIDNEKGKIKYTSSEFNRYQIVSQTPFPKIGKHCLMVRILKQQPERAICVGFITESRRNAESSGDLGDQQSFGFWTYTSGQCQIDVNGEYAQAQKYDKERLGCAVDGHFTITLDCNLNRIKIQRLKNQLQEDSLCSFINIPEAWRGKAFYPFVSMIQKDDQIETTYQLSH